MNFSCLSHRNNIEMRERGICCGTIHVKKFGNQREQCRKKHPPNLHEIIKKNAIKISISNFPTQLNNNHPILKMLSASTRIEHNHKNSRKSIYFLMKFGNHVWSLRRSSLARGVIIELDRHNDRQVI